MASAVHQGLWTNYLQTSSYLQWTLTLNTQYGGFLLSALVLLIHWTGSSLWSIVAFTLHQLRAGTEPIDGLEAQINVILRNHPTHVTTVWLLAYLVWTWRGRARNVYRRVAKVAIWPLSIAMLFTVLSILAAKTASSTQDLNGVLIRPSSCGIVTGGGGAFASAQAQANMVANFSRAAAAIVDARSSSSDQMANGLPTQQINFTEANVPCQFPGLNRCRSDPWQLTSQYINSNKDLGVNTGPSSEVEISIQQTCTVAKVDDLITTVPDASIVGNSSVIYRIDLGSTIVDEGATFVYAQRLEMDNLPYSINSISHVQGNDDSITWMPNSIFNLPSADITAHLIASNSVRSLQPIVDPGFLATGIRNSTTIDGTFLYLADQPFHIVVCTTAASWRNPSNDASTGILGYSEAWEKAQEELGFNSAQMAVAGRIYFASFFASNYNIVTGQGPNSLLSTKSLSGLIVASLPSDQSRRDFIRWFQTSLLVLLARMVDFPTNTFYSPTSPDTADLSFVPANAFNGSAGVELLAQCKEQRVQIQNEFVNFFFYPVLTIIIPGLLIILISFVLPKATHKLPPFALAQQGDGASQNRRARRHIIAGRQAHRRIAYAGDSLYNLHRGAVRGGGWQGGTTSSPYRNELDPAVERIPRPVYVDDTIVYPPLIDDIELSNSRPENHAQSANVSQQAPNDHLSSQLLKRSPAMSSSSSSRSGTTV